MASVARTELTKSEHDELCCVYSALVLHDDGLEITVVYMQADKLQKVITASGNNVEKYWPNLFANAVKGQDVAGLLMGVGAGAPTGAATTAAQPVKDEETKPDDTKKNDKEDDDDDALAGGIGFGDDDEWQLDILHKQLRDFFYFFVFQL